MQAANGIQAGLFYFYFRFYSNFFGFFILETFTSHSLRSSFWKVHGNWDFLFLPGRKLDSLFLPGRKLDSLFLPGRKLDLLFACRHVIRGRFMKYNLKLL
jgi:hypothetical protein